MNNKTKALNLLGLASKAGKLQSGQSLVIESIRHKKAKLVIVSSDASENTKKQIINKSNYYGVSSYIIFTKNEISNAIGKDRTACAFLDQGFAEAFKKLQ